MGICSPGLPPAFLTTIVAMNREFSVLTVILGLFLLLCFPGPLSAVSAENENGLDRTITRDGITFHIRCPNNSSLNEMILEITAPGTGRETIRREVDGTVVDVGAGDLDGNGLPEIYIFTCSAGSGSYGEVIAYSASSEGPPRAIAITPLNSDPASYEGYMGHDAFTLHGNTLLRTFPIYKKNDPNAAPSGGTRQIRYGLVHTDKGYLLRPVCMSRQ
jgi:hypothetical protein